MSHCLRVCYNLRFSVRCFGSHSGGGQVTNFLILHLNNTLNMFLKPFDVRNRQCGNRILNHISSALPSLTVWSDLSEQCVFRCYCLFFQLYGVNKCVLVWDSGALLRLPVAENVTAVVCCVDCNSWLFSIWTYLLIVLSLGLENQKTVKTISHNH